MVNPDHEEMGKQLHPLVQLAKQAVEAYVRQRELIKPTNLTPEMEERAGVFVSLKIKGDLRGCIGTYQPTQRNVAEEIVLNAIRAATRDPRFPPVTEKELPFLSYSIDVLSLPEPVNSIAELDARRYGVIVEALPPNDFRRGLLLPDLEGVDTPEEQIAIARRKAGILPEEPVRIYRFEVRRYK